MVFQQVCRTQPDMAGRQCRCRGPNPESLYLDRATKQLAADGFPVTDDLLARLSPLQFDHINFYLDKLQIRYWRTAA
ncbi:Tn3 family transposase [Kitasatospora sp. NPDC058063]|uniref:Tn3 family transposase n=1 Tax=unclassified Kitasatospora TaxID=2633591 RepID=UPI0036DB3FB6